jgi:hypothetical protein
MATEKISVGVPTAISQTTAYALPSVRTWITSTSPIAFANAVAGTYATDVVASTTSGVEAAGAFVRCTSTTTCVVVIKKM